MTKTVMRLPKPCDIKPKTLLDFIFWGCSAARAGGWCPVELEVVLKQGGRSGKENKGPLSSRVGAGWMSEWIDG